MKRNFNVSVAMATYNGEKYIEKQIESIVKQLEINDELVISDDGSSDNTIKIIEKLSKKYTQIKLLDGPKKGVKQNFANAISNCNGKYIFLSDQDDIWINDKVVKVVEEFEKDTNIYCITHNCDVVNGDMSEVLIDSFFEHRKSRAGVFANIYKNRYLGCCMAFRNDMKKYILPIPNDIEMHDQWIGVLCDKYGKSLFLNEKLIHYRRHGGNVSEMHHYPLMKMIKNRIRFCLNLLKNKME